MTSIAKPNQPVFIFIEQTSLTLYSHKLLTGVQLPIPPGSLVNMELTDTSAFCTQITNIITAQNLAGASALFVFGSSLYFEKAMPTMTAEQGEEELKRFAQSTPFDRVAAKLYKSGTGAIAVTINRDLFDELRECCVRAGIFVTGVIPALVLKPYIPATGLSPAVVRSLLAKEETLTAQAIAVGKARVLSFQEQEEYLSTHYQGLIVVIFILFLIAVFAVTGYLLQRQSRAVRAPRTSPSPTVPLVVSTPEPVPPITVVEVASPSALRIQIVYGESTASVAAAVVNRLQQGGYSQAVRVRQAGVSVEEPLLLYTATVSTRTREQFASTISQLVPSFSSSQAEALDSDITLILGR